MSKSRSIDHSSRNPFCKLIFLLAHAVKTILPVSLAVMVIASFGLAIALNLTESATKEAIATEQMTYIKYRDTNGNEQCKRLTGTVDLSSDFNFNFTEHVNSLSIKLSGNGDIEFEMQKYDTGGIYAYTDGACSNQYGEIIFNSTEKKATIALTSSKFYYAYLIDSSWVVLDQAISNVITTASGNGQGAVSVSDSSNPLPVLSIGKEYNYELTASDTIKITDANGRYITFSGLVDNSMGRIQDKRILITVVKSEQDKSTEAAMIVSANSTNGKATVEDAETFMRNNYGSSAASNTGPGSDTASGTSSAGSSEASSALSCTKSAQGFGFILCGIGNLAYQAMNFFYQVVEDRLNIDTDIFSLDTGVHNTWSVFRNIANVIFIIYLLVMIFSQITGIGISNYGIKKNLPRVIVASILLNASYYLCIVAVDLSNIIGASLKAFFSYIASGIAPMPGNALFDAAVGSLSSTSTNTALSWTASGGLAFGVLITGFTAMATKTGFGATAGMLTAGAVSSLLILVVNIILVAACTLLGMYLILTLRQSLTVLMIAAAPLAILAYTLPNTKNLFNLWWKVGKGLILLYPICGFVVGIGNLASSIILSVGNSASQFIVALIAQIGPYFLLPGLFKGTLAAVGNLNAKINGITGNVHKTTSTAVNNTATVRKLNDRAGRLGNMVKRARDANFEAYKFDKDSKEAEAQVAELREWKSRLGEGEDLNRAEYMLLNRAQGTVRQTRQTLANEFVSRYREDDERLGQDHNKKAYFDRLQTLVNKEKLAPDEEVELMSLIQHMAKTPGLDGDFQGLIAGRTVDGRTLTPKAIKKIYSMQPNLPSDVGADIIKQGATYYFLSQEFAGKKPDYKAKFEAEINGTKRSREFTYDEVIKASAKEDRDAATGRLALDEAQQIIWKSAYKALIKGKAEVLINQDSKNLEYFLESMEANQRTEFGKRLATMPSQLLNLSESKANVLQKYSEIWPIVEAARNHALGM